MYEFNKNIKRETITASLFIYLSLQTPILELHTFLLKSGSNKETNKILNRRQRSPYFRFLWLSSLLFLVLFLVLWCVNLMFFVKTTCSYGTGSYP